MTKSRVITTVLFALMVGEFAMADDCATGDFRCVPPADHGDGSTKAEPAAEVPRSKDSTPPREAATAATPVPADNGWKHAPKCAQVFLQKAVGAEGQFALFATSKDTTSNEIDFAYNGSIFYQRAAGVDKARNRDVPIAKSPWYVRPGDVISLRRSTANAECTTHFTVGGTIEAPQLVPSEAPTMETFNKAYGHLQQQQQQQQTTAGAVGGDFATQGYEVEFMNLLNNYRARFGLRALAFSAVAKGLAMANNVEQRARGLGHHVFDIFNGRQNSGVGYQSVHQIFNAWLASPGHYQALVDPTIVSAAIDFDGHNWTWNAEKVHGASRNTGAAYLAQNGGGFQQRAFRGGGGGFRLFGGRRR